MFGKHLKATVIVVLIIILIALLMVDKMITSQAGNDMLHRLLDGKIPSQQEMGLRLLKRAVQDDLIICNYSAPAGQSKSPRMAILVETNNRIDAVKGVKYIPPSPQYPPDKQISIGTFRYTDFSNCRIQLADSWGDYPAIVGEIILRGPPLPEKK